MADIKRQILIESIRRDAMFIGRLIGSTRSGPANKVMPMVVFAMANFMSLFVFEARRQVPYIGPVFAEPVLSQGFEEAVARSRHMLKLFEDRHRNIKDQIAFFEDGIVQAHRGRFVGHARWPIVSFLEKDLGICRYGDVEIISSHVANLALGVDAAEYFSPGANERRRATAVEYGKFFATRGATLDESSKSFASCLRPEEVKWRDVKSWKTYPHGFNGPDSLGLNAWLRTFWMWLNFTNTLLPLDRQEESTYTTCKLQFLVLYAIARSCNELRKSPPVALTNTSSESISGIVDDADTKLFVSDSGRSLRNALMHYRPDESLEDSVFDLGSPLYGFTERYFDGMNLDEFRQRMDDWGCRARQVFDRWSR